jgi:phage gp36-like protein
MLYATVTDMVERYSEREMIALTDRDGVGEVNASLLNRSIADAVAFVDGFVGKVYKLPLLGCAKPVTVVGAPVQYVAPPVLTRITCDLARYYLYTDLPDEHEVTRRHKQVIAELKALADGSTQLVCPWGGSPGIAINADPLVSAEVYHSFAPRQINDDSLRGFA